MAPFGLIQGLVDALEQVAGQRLVRGHQRVRDGAFVEQQRARLVPEPVAVDGGPMRERPQRTDLVDACDESAELAQRVRRVEVGPAAGQRSGVDGAEDRVVFDLTLGDRETLGFTAYRAERLELYPSA